MNAAIAQLRAEQVSDEERRRVVEFVEANEDSPVSILLRRLLTVTGHGVDVTVLSDDTAVSPNDAAHLLKMSRPHLLTFMNRGALPFHKVGSHRRIYMADLLAFMHARESGAAVVAEALGSSMPSPSSSTPLTDRERDELNEF